MSVTKLTSRFKLQACIGSALINYENEAFSDFVTKQ